MHGDMTPQFAAELKVLQKTLLSGLGGRHSFTVSDGVKRKAVAAPPGTYVRNCTLSYVTGQMESFICVLLYPALCNFQFQGGSELKKHLNYNAAKARIVQEAIHDAQVSLLPLPAC